MNQREAFEMRKEQWGKMDPMEISERTSVEYCQETKEFLVRLMNVDYRIAYPVFKVTCEESQSGYRPLEDFWTMQSYVLEFLMTKSAPRKEGKRYTNIPWGRVAEGIYPINGGKKSDICLTTVDYALTYFLVACELEKTGIPCNLIIINSGGISVTTAWAMGKYGADTIADYFEKEEIEKKISCRELMIPGKVEMIAEELKLRLPKWKIIPAPKEAVELGDFLKRYMRGRVE